MRDLLLFMFWNRRGGIVSLRMRADVAAAKSKDNRGFMMRSDNFKYVLEVVQIERTGSIGLDATFRLHTCEDILRFEDLQQRSTLFEARFSRCRKVLYFLACRVLGSPEQADAVVENCKITASRNPPTFEYEGAFRSWLVRILIDEALAIVRERTRAK
jgi:Sigma-70 region 2